MKNLCVGLNKPGKLLLNHVTYTTRGIQSSMIDAENSAPIIEQIPLLDPTLKQFISILFTKTE
jgi:hypothetical protein